LTSKSNFSLSACICLSLVVAGLVTPAQAQKPGGTITGTLDGKPLTCQINASNSDFSGSGDALMITITAYPCTGAAELRIVRVSFTKEEKSTSRHEVRLLQRNKKPDLYSDTRRGASVELTSMKEDDGFLSLTGSVTAKLGPSSDRGTTIDLTAPLALQLSFKGVVEVLGH
jgi:hypothetical protein